MPHPFLSPEWIDEARRIRDEYQGRGTQIPERVRVNLVVTGVPFGGGTIDAYIDTSSGEVDVETGHLAAPDVSLTLDYDLARSILVDGDVGAVMPAFAGGRLRVDGDLAKLIILQGRMSTPDPIALEIGGRVREMTA